MENNDGKEYLIACYENEIPEFAGAEMERLYESPFSSPAVEHADEAHTSTYVVRNQGEVITVFLFQRIKGRVKVLNATITICAEEVCRFASYIFNRYESVGAISFEAIQPDISSLPFPFQRFNSSENIVLTLPDTVQAYMTKLGSSTRRTIRRHTEMLGSDFPSYRYQIYEKEDISERQIRDIIDLNTARMDGKNKVSTIDEEQKNWVIKIAKQHGVIGVATINDRICAGVICSRVGSNYFMHIIAHDPQYNKYKLGTVCSYLMICGAIANGSKEFHFLWGQGEYKYRFLGVRRDLDNLIVYQSRIRYFLKLDMVLKNGFAKHFRQLKLRLEKNAGDGTWVSRLLGKLLAAFYTIKRLKHRIGSAMQKLLS